MVLNANIPAPPGDNVAIASFGSREEVTDAELSRYAELIYRRTGIRIPPQKKTLLSNRLRRRLRATGTESFAAYYELLIRLRPQDREWDAFLQEITTHETYLFRDERQWNWFREAYLPEAMAEAQAGRRGKSLRIWSAACSTGDEAYTAACCIAATLPNPSQWSVRITGTDIGCGAVAQAQDPAFGDRAMKLVPDGYKKRFFNKVAGANVWQPRQVLSEMVEFRQHNLLHPLRSQRFDLVLLKNVLIYFAPESKQRVVENVCSLLRPGGYLVSGPTEGIVDLMKDYAKLQPWLYRRPQQ